MEIKRYIIQAILQKSAEVEDDSLFVPEFMPERLGRILEKELKEEDPLGFLHYDLNEWEFHLKKTNATIGISSGSKSGRGNLVKTAVFYVNLANGMVALQGVQ